MPMDWLLLGSALCLVLVIEGIALFLAPQRLREAAALLARLDDRSLRVIGLIAMLTGAGLLMLLRA